MLGAGGVFLKRVYPGVVVNACNPSTWEAAAGGLEFEVNQFSTPPRGNAEQGRSTVKIRFTRHAEMETVRGKTHSPLGRSSLPHGLGFCPVFCVCYINNYLHVSSPKEAGTETAVYLPWHVINGSRGKVCASGNPSIQPIEQTPKVIKARVIVCVCFCTELSSWLKTLIQEHQWHTWLCKI